jgi:hypothetical protein
VRIEAPAVPGKKNANISGWGTTKKQEIKEFANQKPPKKKLRSDFA